MIISYGISMSVPMMICLTGIYDTCIDNFLSTFSFQRNHVPSKYLVNISKASAGTYVGTYEHTHMLSLP